jgi:exodeoxyribonuclease VII small subunit
VGLLRRWSEGRGAGRIRLGLICLTLFVPVGSVNRFDPPPGHCIRCNVEFMTVESRVARTAPPARDTSEKPVDETPVDFERSLAELEGLVERLEQGDLPLDEALKSFERGVALTRQCQSALKAAQQKVEILLNSDADTAPEPFTENADAALVTGE